MTVSVWAAGACVAFSSFFLFLSLFSLLFSFKVQCSLPRAAGIRRLSYCVVVSSGAYYGFVHVALPSHSIAHAYGFITSYTYSYIGLTLFYRFNITVPFVSFVYDSFIRFLQFCVSYVHHSFIRLSLYILISPSLSFIPPHVTILSYTQHFVLSSRYSFPTNC